MLDVLVLLFCSLVLKLTKFTKLSKANVEFQILFTSWGGTPKVMVLRSTFWYDSMHGRTKKIPEKIEKY